MPIIPCPVCGFSFDNQGNPLRVYCGPRCRGKMARSKERTKYRTDVLRTEVKKELVMVEPTASQLTAVAELLLTEVLPGAVIVKALPQGWQPPEGTSCEPVPIDASGLVMWSFKKGQLEKFTQEELNEALRQHLAGRAAQ